MQEGYPDAKIFFQWLPCILGHLTEFQRLLRLSGVCLGLRMFKCVSKGFEKCEFQSKSRDGITEMVIQNKTTETDLQEQKEN